MSATKAFDLALFVPVPANVNDGVVVSSLGPPFATKFAPLVTGGGSGVVVGSSTPAATAQGQIMLSGPGPGFAWGLGTSPAVAATVPPPTTASQLLVSDATLTWQTMSYAAFFSSSGAVTNSGGGSFTPSANLVFAASVAARARIDGGDPNFSLLDNFTIDAGTF